MQIQLNWTDPNTGQQQQPILQTPVALGQEFAAMPNQINGNPVSRIVLADSQVNDYHALIDSYNGELMIVDQNSSVGTLINGIRLPSSTIIDGDRLQIGSYQIQIKLSVSAAASTNSEGTWQCDRMVGFLFSRRCGRTSKVGCPDCGGNYENNEPYFSDRSYYSGYGRYDRGYWGNDYYNRDHYGNNTETNNVDFTESDNAALESEVDGDFEQDMGAS